MATFSLVTIWFTKHPHWIDVSNYSTVVRWLHSYVDSWGKCDQFRYRILSPMVYRYPEIYGDIEQWAESDKTCVRRAAAVSLIRISGTSFAVDYPIEKVLHIQKAVGWVLKYA